MVTSISFCPEGGHKIAAAYSSSKFLALTDAVPKMSYIWDISSSPPLPFMNSNAAHLPHKSESDAKETPARLKYVRKSQVERAHTQRFLFASECSFHLTRCIDAADGGSAKGEIMLRRKRDSKRVSEPLRANRVVFRETKGGSDFLLGLYNGQVSWWDTRQGPRPVESTSLEVSHAQTVTALTWMALKARTELFTVSTDGQVLWWDTRKLSQPTDTLVLDPLREDPPNLARALTATCVEYEVSMPTKLMVATEQGKVVACNRRARSPPDRISMIYNAHIAPIYAIQRNPFLLKNFMTVGDWTIKLWAEDFKESPILWTKPSPSQVDAERLLECHKVFGLVHSPARWHSGCLGLFDLLARTLGFRSGSRRRPGGGGAHDGGRLLVVGSQLGTLSLLHVPSRLVTPSDKHEKAAFTSLLERETRRERVLEARHKEQRLRERVRGGGAGRGLMRRAEESHEGDEAVKRAEEEYLRRVEQVRENGYWRGEDSADGSEALMGLEEDQGGKKRLRGNDKAIG
ncbi:putative dynein intermediate chain 2, axonemal [Penaeus vannamei]|uniref:Putative dynein intermediate chain 2, axonemal n=1 Tax=Penaeus vannamei TaxID=6689 RepID=A0A423TGI3_PENVA|nr:putative dynein intermediate chain 2, axonemal [Penaeus vannamei]